MYPGGSLRALRLKTTRSYLPLRTGRAYPLLRLAVRGSRPPTGSGILAANEQVVLAADVVVHALAREAAEREKALRLYATELKARYGITL